MPAEEHFDQDRAIGGAFRQNIHDPRDKQIRVGVQSIHECRIHTPVGSHTIEAWHSWRRLGQQLLRPAPPIEGAPPRAPGQNAVKARIGFRVEVQIRFGEGCDKWRNRKLSQRLDM
ncbi:MAG: hypothetical protein ACJ8CR_17800 [Roseiflexaceae bacterium]